MKKRARSDGPTLPMKMLERVSASDSSHHNRLAASRAGPSRKALRRQKKQLKKKKAIMLAEQLERRARKRRVVEDPNDREYNDEEDEEDVEDEDELLNESAGEAVTASAVTAAAAPVSASYVPPHLRSAGGKSSESSALKKSIRGILNKLAEGTLFSSAQKIANLVYESSRSEVIDCLCGEMVADTSADATLAVTNKLVAVFAALVGILYHEHNMGLLLPSTIAELLVGKFDEVYAAHDVKRAVNMAVFLGYLFHFSIVGPIMIMDLCKRLAGSFGAMDVEVLLKLMQLIGMKLRTDVPGELAAVLVTVAEKTTSLKASGESEMTLRTQFMSETLASIKNNRYMNVDEHLAQINKATKAHHGENGGAKRTQGEEKKKNTRGKNNNNNVLCLTCFFFSFG
jgi:hypothetical protein